MHSHKNEKPSAFDDYYIKGRGTQALTFRLLEEQMIKALALMPGSTNVSQLWRWGNINQILANSDEAENLLAEGDYRPSPWVITPFNEF